MKCTYKNFDKILKEYIDRNEENCATCKWCGLFMTLKGHYFICRRFKYTCEISSLGNYCSEWEERVKVEDNDW